MKKAKTPKAPDYTALANQQAAIAKQNWKDQTVAMRPDQTGPEGTRVWEQDPQGNWSETITMTPERQQIWDTLQGKTQEQLAGYNTGQISLAGAPAMPTVGGYNEQAINTIRALQAPDLARRRAAKEAQLAAMGIGTGTGQAWNTEQQNIGDAESRADLEAILAGINQGNTEFGQAMDLHQTGTQDILAQEQANQAKMAGMMGQSNTFRLPEFANAPTPGMPGEATPDLLNAANASYQAAVDRANAKAAGNPWNQIIGIGSSLAGSYLGGLK